MAAHWHRIGAGPWGAKGGLLHLSTQANTDEIWIQGPGNMVWLEGFPKLHLLLETTSPAVTDSSLPQERRDKPKWLLICVSLVLLCLLLILSSGTF